MTPRSGNAWATLTSVGRVRTHNEDTVLGEPPLFVVADGLGGHEAGEVASAIAVETLRDHSPRRADAKALGRAVRAANREVIRAAREGVGRSGMGTTLTAAIVDGACIAIAHVGDSRAYLLHDGRLEQLTDDHSMVADLIRRGQLSEEDARIHPHRSVITRALGTDADMVADHFEVEAARGDRLLLCSDGLTGMLENETIAEILAAHREPKEAASALVDAANAAGGQDNISVVIVDIDDGGSASSGTREGERRLRGWLTVAGWIAAFAIVVGGVAFATYRYASDRAYLVAENGTIVVYRGVPGELAGITLSWRHTDSGVPVDTLSAGGRARLESGETFADLDEAYRALSAYRAEAERVDLESAPATVSP